MHDYFRTEGESPIEVEEVAYHENEFDFQYKDNIRYILSNGEERTDRTGVRTMSAFGDVGHKIDLRRAYPATTLKRLAFQTMKVETIDWMLQGKCDLKTLKDKGVRIWDQNVIPGTEVYTYHEASGLGRLKFCTSGQKMNIRRYARDIGVPAAINPKALQENIDNDAGFTLDSSQITDEQLRLIDAKLNNWGVPDTERVLVDGDLGPIYGKQWRDWEDLRMVRTNELYGDAWEKYGSRGFEHTPFDNGRGWTLIRRSIDQVMDVDKAIKNRSDSRRIILTGWNVAQLDEMSLPPCHTMAQWYVSQKRDENGLQFLDCKLYQRSADFLLGVPFNVAQYALITEMYAKAHGLRARFLHHTVGDAHIYMNHLEQGFVEEIMNRPVIHKAPKLQIKSLEQNSILDFTVWDFSLVGYESHDAQKNVPIAK